MSLPLSEALSVAKSASNNTSENEKDSNSASSSSAAANAQSVAMETDEALQPGLSRPGLSLPDLQPGALQSEKILSVDANVFSSDEGVEKKRSVEKEGSIHAAVNSSEAQPGLAESLASRLEAQGLPRLEIPEMPALEPGLPRLEAPEIQAAPQPMQVAAPEVKAEAEDQKVAAEVYHSKLLNRNGEHAIYPQYLTTGGSNLRSSRYEEFQRMKSLANNNPPNLEALFDLGVCYAEGYAFVSQNMHLAYECLSKAAAGGLAIAQWWFADMIKDNYFSNIGIEEIDSLDEEAFKKKIFLLYFAAAKQRFAAAQFDIAECYSENYNYFSPIKEMMFKINENIDPIVRRDYVFTWKKRAAKLGHPEAQHDIAVCYRDNIGVPPDEQNPSRYRKALKYCQLAVSNNFSGPNKNPLEMFEGLVTVCERLDAEKKARDAKKAARAKAQAENQMQEDQAQGRDNKIKKEKQVKREMQADQDKKAKAERPKERSPAAAKQSPVAPKSSPLGPQRPMAGQNRLNQGPAQSPRSLSMYNSPMYNSPLAQYKPLPVDSSGFAVPASPRQPSPRQPGFVKPGSMAASLRPQHSVSNSSSSNSGTGKPALVSPRQQQSASSSSSNNGKSPLASPKLSNGGVSPRQQNSGASSSSNSNNAKPAYVEPKLQAASPSSHNGARGLANPGLERPKFSFAFVNRPKPPRAPQAPLDLQTQQGLQVPLVSQAQQAPQAGNGQPQSAPTRKRKLVKLSDMKGLPAQRSQSMSQLDQLEHLDQLEMYDQYVAASGSNEMQEPVSAAVKQTKMVIEKQRVQSGPASVQAQSLQQKPKPVAVKVEGPKSKPAVKQEEGQPLLFKFGQEPDGTKPVAPSRSSSCSSSKKDNKRKCPSPSPDSDDDSPGSKKRAVSI